MNNVAAKKTAEKEYAVINLKYEYPGYVGYEKYAIISDLGKEELKERYGAELEAYEPYITMSIAEGEAIREFNRNEDKYTKRKKRSVDAYGYEEGTSEVFHEELVQDNLFDIVSGNLDKEKLRTLLPKLTDTQRRRIEMYYFEDFSVREIADLEGADVHAVHKSIQGAIAKLKKLFGEK